METLKGEFVLNDVTKESSGTTMKDTTQSSPTPTSATSPLTSHNHAAHGFSNPHFFSSFVEYPRNVSFADQEENEEIILIIRRHFVTNVPWIISAVLLSIFPFTLFPLVVLVSPFPVLLPQTEILLLLFYYLAIFGFILLRFTLWYFHIGIITSTRIRDIDIHGILYKDVSEAKNEFIQDVSYSQIGFVRSVFNYGEVSVQTAGSKPNIEFDKAPKPSIIARIIGDLLGINT